MTINLYYTQRGSNFREVDTEQNLFGVFKCQIAVEQRSSPEEAVIVQPSMLPSTGIKTPLQSAAVCIFETESMALFSFMLHPLLYCKTSSVENWDGLQP